MFWYSLSFIRSPIYSTVNDTYSEFKFREMGSILNKKRNVKRRVLKEQKLEEIGERLENSSQKSLRRLAQETDISKALAWSNCWPRLHVLPLAKSYSKLTVYILYSIAISLIFCYSNPVHKWYGTGIVFHRYKFELFLINHTILVHPLILCKFIKLFLKYT